MNPYNEINNLDKVINDLERGLSYSKNKTKDIHNLNIIINSRNAFESMLNEKYKTDAVEILIYHRILYLYKQFDIANGGDIDKAEELLMNDFKTVFSLGVDYEREIVIDELRKYLDYHSLIDGDISKDSDDIQMKVYLKIQDELIEEKLNERISKIKNLINYKTR
tara:strand:- start:1282 stop:1776 length:495 start_codon:yes stop_codon:yes gene_type:complete